MLLFIRSNKSPLKSNIQFQQHILKAWITVFFPTFSHGADIFIKSSNQSHVAWPWLCGHSRVRYTPCTMLFYHTSATVKFSHISINTVNQYRPAVWHCVCNCKPLPCSSITLLQQLCSVTSVSTLWISIAQQYGTVCVSHHHAPPSPFCSSCAQFLQSFNFLINIPDLCLSPIKKQHVYLCCYICANLLLWMHCMNYCSTMPHSITIFIWHVATNKKDMSYVTYKTLYLFKSCGL